jgi:5,10-methylenetetrahydrofolate reductase
MRIADLYAADGSSVLSLEFFTPKNEAGRKALFRAVERLGAIEPGFVSVTCGAAGTTRERTADLAIELQERFGLTAMAHLVCTGTTQSDLAETVRHMQAHGIDNILALRGDPPKGATDWTPVEGGFRHADELVAFVLTRLLPSRPTSGTSSAKSTPARSSSSRNCSSTTTSTGAFSTKSAPRVSTCPSCRASCQS